VDTTGVERWRRPKRHRSPSPDRRYGGGETATVVGVDTNKHYGLSLMYIYFVYLQSAFLFTSRTSTPRSKETFCCSSQYRGPIFCRSQSMTYQSHCTISFRLFQDKGKVGPKHESIRPKGFQERLESRSLWTRVGRWCVAQSKQGRNLHVHLRIRGQCQQLSKWHRQCCPGPGPGPYHHHHFRSLRM
jgi:hypothetical protein